MKIIKKYKYIYIANLRNLSLKNRLIIGLRLFKRQIFRLNSPISMMIGLTYRCQCNCVHCCAGDQPVLEEQELTTQEITSVIDEAMKLGICKVRFFGGEPMFRQDLLYLTNYASQKGLIVSMDTNGEFLTGTTVKKLKKSGMCEVDISIDSCTPEIHDKLRNRDGSFQLALEAAKNCIKEGLAVILQTYITRESIERGDLKGIIELGKELRVTGIKILFPVATGKLLNHTKIILTDKEKQYISHFLDSSFVFFEGQGNYDFKSCSLLKKETFYVSPYGDVRACCFIPLDFGNVRSEKLETIWERMSNNSLYRDGYSPCVMNDKKFREKYIMSG